MKSARVLTALAVPATVLATVPFASTAEAAAAPPAVSSAASTQRGSFTLVTSNGRRVTVYCENSIGAKGKRNGKLYIKMTFWGKTKCTGAIKMSGVAHLTTTRGRIEARGKKFNAKTTVDASNGSFAHATHGSKHTLIYRTVWHAPPRSVWGYAGPGCKGVGTKILTCGMKKTYRVP